LRYNALMKRLIIVLAFLFSASLPAQAPVAVPVGKEPHHHLVLENDYARVFRVSVPPHDATLLHQHDLPYVYVSLGPADFINAVAGKPEARVVMTDGQVGYSRGGFAHIARTDAGVPFDNITIELLHPQGEPRNLCAQIVPGAASGGCGKASGSADRGHGFSVEPQLETQEMSLDLVRLEPETSSPKLALPSNSLLVCLNGTEVRIDVDGKPAKTLQGGEVIWIDGGVHGFASNPSKKASTSIQLSFKDNGGGAKP